MGLLRRVELAAAKIIVSPLAGFQLEAIIKI